MIRRYAGWHLRPMFAPVVAWSTVGPGISEHPGSAVDLAFDDTNLTQWFSHSATVWQTPLSEVHALEMEVGRRLRLRATIAGVQYTWSTRRRPEHDELIETVREKGGRIVRTHRTRAVSVLTVAAALVVASVATIATWLLRNDKPSRSQVAAINVQGSDLPTTWQAVTSGVLPLLIGNAGDIVTSSTTTSQPSTSFAPIINKLAANFEACEGLTKSHDRMFGAAGVAPWLQISGSTFGSANFNGTEIGSLTQYYNTTAMVNDDVAQYSRPQFGRCWALQGAQSLLAISSGSVSILSTKLAPRNYTPVTFARAWRRGGTVTLTLPNQAGTYTLVAVLAAQGHQEVAFYAITGDWPHARPVIEAALEAVLARLAPGSSSNAA